MKMENKPFTRLTLEQSDTKIVIEKPYEDVSGNEMVEMLETIMVGMTFLPETIYKLMKDRVEELSEIYEKDCDC